MALQVEEYNNVLDKIRPWTWQPGRFFMEENTLQRISPLSGSGLSPDQSQLLDQFPEEMRSSNLLRTLIREPRAVRALMPWSSYIAGRTSLAPRLREIVILRTSFAGGAGYEWAHHVDAARRAGLSDAEIAALGSACAGDGWGALEGAAILACGQLVHERRINDETWARLGAHLDQGALLELVLTVAQYTQMAIITNALGIALEPDASAP